MMHTAKLISITPDAEKIMAYCARVSSKNQTNSNIAALLKYCLQQGHVSVFELANMVLEITTTRAISPQILRHRSFSFQELCMAGDAKISLDGMGQVSLEYIYKMWRHGHMSLSQKARCFDEISQNYIWANIVDVFNTGIKPIYEYTDELGNKVACTKDHKVLTKQGFLPIGKAYAHQLVVAREQDSWVRLIGEEFRANEQTYDLAIDHCSHNYVANGFCVHNSFRYANPAELEIPLPTLLQSAHDTEWRYQDAKNRQNSIEPNEYELVRLSKFTARFMDLAKEAQDLYDDLLKAGIAKECARGVLPMNQPCRLYMNGTIRSWLHYIKLRTDKATQKEHRLIAESAKAILAEQLPIVHESAFG